MIYLKTQEEIELIRESCLLVGKVLAELAKVISPGITTLELDTLAAQFILDNGAIPAFKNYRGFPNSICTSKNEEVVHGIPNNIPLIEGDILSVDCGVLKNEFYGDSAYTFEVGEINEEKKKLMQVTMEALYKGIEMAATGKRVGDISYAVQTHAESHGYFVVRELVGHGVGKKLHEDPEVPNYGKRGSGPQLQAGLVIAIEPMINLGTKKVVSDKDNWTVRAVDGKPSAHFEHTVVIRRNQPADILSTFTDIEKTLQKQNSLVHVEPVIV